MRSLILITTSRMLLPLLLLLSVFLLLRGHYEPGGGFIGGLVASAGFLLYLIAAGIDKAKQALRIDPRTLMTIGLLISVASGIVPMFFGETYKTGIWLDQHIPVIGSLGTPLIFDIGVYFVVIGVTLSILFALAEE